jgi:hypothetical protein
MFPPVPEVKGNGGVISESWESSFSSVVNVAVSCTSSSELCEFIGRKLGIVIDDIEVRILRVSYRCVLVVFCPSD